MIQTELFLSFILTTNVLGSYSNSQPQYAISSQSYHRDDAPLSYEFTVVHNIRPRKADLSNGYQYPKNNKYRTIQYAPLNSRQYRKQMSHSLRPKYEGVTMSVRQTTGSQTPHTTAENINLYLEPRPFAENVNNLKHRAQIMRHHASVVTQPRKQVLENVSFYPEDIENSPVQISKYNQPKSNQQFSTSAINNIPPPLVSQNQYAFGYLPFQEEPKLLHDQLIFEKPQSQYQHAPRLHMNVARSYNIAGMMQKAPSAPNNNNNKEPSRLYGYFIPSAEEERTQLFPVN